MAYGSILGQTANTYSKEQIMAPNIPALYGLDSDAVPTDVLAWLGKYNQYWWRRAQIIPVEVKKDITQDYKVNSTSTRQIYYASQVSVSETGEIDLVNQSTLSITGSLTSATQLKNLAPCYIKNIDSAPQTVFYLPENSTVGQSDTNQTIYFLAGIYLSSTAAVKAKIVTGEIGKGEYEYIQSTNRYAYPDSGEQDGYEYQYLGIPFENSVGPMMKIETGSYVGTGTYGASNPNSLTFEFEPKIWGIIFDKYGTKNGDVVLALLLWGVPETSQSFRFFSGGTGLQCNGIDYVDRTVSWYSSNGVNDQLNESGHTYYYFALG